MNDSHIEPRLYYVIGEGRVERCGILTLGYGESYTAIRGYGWIRYAKNSVDAIHVSKSDTSDKIRARPCPTPLKKKKKPAK